MIWSYIKAYLERFCFIIDLLGYNLTVKCRLSVVNTHLRVNHSLLLLLNIKV